MKLSLLVLLSSLSVGNVTAPSELICSHQPIIAQAGGDVILPCHLKPPISASSETVEWTKPGLEPKYVHVHQDGRLVLDHQNPSYHYRTRLFVDQLMNGNVSMKIFRVKISDAGKYKCFLPSIQKEASIQLNVGESDVIGSHEPVKVTVGHDAILPCHLQPPFDMTTLTVEWTRNGKDVHLYRGRKDDLVNQDKDFKDRTSLFHDEMTRGNISLKLTNVTELDAGSYTCFVPKLPSQVRSGYITLTVEPVEKSNDGSQTSDKNQDPVQDGDTGAITGIVFGIIAAIILVAGLAGFAIWKCGLIRTSPGRHRRGCNSHTGTSAGREKRGSKRENTESRPENRPETVPLKNTDTENS